MKFPTILKENKSFIIFILLMVVFRSAIADWNTVPTGSMKPTILEGDRILVNKLAYDLRVPFTQTSLLTLGEPVRGDIVIFESQVSDIRLVKRVVGIPGDTVAMKDNVLYLNGQPLAYEDLSTAGLSIDRLEELAGTSHAIRVNNAGSQLSSFYPVITPPEHYLVLGDNRDNSADSRVIGFVPRDEIIGRARQVVLSFNYDNFYLPRPDRFFYTL